jgi:HAD superfamily hydrolase (TIGR01509 family)
MDGVLVDTAEAHYHAWGALLHKHGRSLTREQFDDAFGMANTPIIRRWFGEDMPLDDVLALADEKERAFRATIAEHVRLGPGVRGWLARARELGYRQAVASSGDMANIVAILTHHDVGNYFDAIVSGAMLPRSKPDPAVFLHAAGSLGIEPAACLVIEDGVVGVEAACRAGMPCLALTTTHPAERLAGADLIVADMTQVGEEDLARLFERKR